MGKTSDNALTTAFFDHTLMGKTLGETTDETGICVDKVLIETSGDRSVEKYPLPNRPYLLLQLTVC